MLIFYFGYVLISEINTGWLAINIWHNAQYIMFVWLFNVNRFGKTVKTESESNMKLTSKQKPIKIMQFISNRKPVQILWYFGFTLAMTVLFYSVMNKGFQFVSFSTGILLTNIYIIGYQSINFHHYIVDSVIWKARNKKNQKAMKIG